MKTFLSLLGLLLLAGCQNPSGYIIEQPKYCSVTSTIRAVGSELRKGSLITCPDGSETFVPNGVNGIDGSPGLDGSNGHSAVISQAPADQSVCQAGGNVISFGIDYNDDTVLQNGETTQAAVVCNGQDGHNGIDSTITPFSPVDIVSACGGDVNDPMNEVFLRLSNGTLLGTVSENKNGKNTHLGVVAPGTWLSTDQNECVFTVNSDGSIVQQ